MKITVLMILAVVTLLAAGCGSSGGSGVTMTCERFYHTGGNPWTQASMMDALAYCTTDGMTLDPYKASDYVTLEPS